MATPRTWAQPPVYTSALLQERDADVRTGVLRGGFAASAAAPEYVAATIGALLHVAQLRRAIRAGIQLLDAVQTALPRASLPQMADDSDWCAQVMRAARAADTMDVLRSLDNWLAWPCSAAATERVAVALRKSAAARAACVVETEAADATASSRAAAVGLLAAVMAELQAAARMTSEIRGAIKLGSTVRDAAGLDFVFAQCTTALSATNLCCRCGKGHATSDVRLSQQLPPIDGVRRTDPTPEWRRHRVDVREALLFGAATTTLARRTCPQCNATCQHRVETRPGAWPQAVLVVGVPPHARPLWVHPTLRLPDRAAEGDVTYTLVSAVAESVSASRPAETVCFVRVVGATVAEDTWRRVSARLGATPASESDLVAELGSGATVLVFVAADVVDRRAAAL